MLKIILISDNKARKLVVKNTAEVSKEGLRFDKIIPSAANGIRDSANKKNLPEKSILPLNEKKRMLAEPAVMSA